jgi:hypothetical protein
VSSQVVSDVGWVVSLVGAGACSTAAAASGAATGVGGAVGAVVGWPGGALVGIDAGPAVGDGWTVGG